MTELVANGLSKFRSASLTGIFRSMINYRHREGNSNDPLTWCQDGRDRIRRHTRHMNLIFTNKKIHRKDVSRTIVVAKPEVMCETDFTKIYIDSEGWIYFTAYMDICSRKIRKYFVSRMS